MTEIKNYIDGKFVEPLSGKTLESYNPAEGHVHAKLPDSGASDIDLAVEAAERAFDHWSNCTAQVRANYLRRIADLIESRRCGLALAESDDNGKPIWLAKQVDIPRAAANFRFFASAIEQFSSESHYMEGQGINYTLRRPVGIAGCISPWNLPLYLLTWKIAPALAAGNCVVAKPSEITPVSAFLLSKLCEEAALPPGVLNIVHGMGSTAGEAIVAHEKISAISFTGGTRTGAHIAAIAAPRFKKLSLELGGKNPNLIFADCEYAKMLETTVKSSFSNQGQICLCGSRILVEASIYDRFRKDFVEKTKKLVVGDPWEKVDLGAVVSREHLDKILRYIEIAQNEGGKILCGGKRIRIEGRCSEGWFIQPTIIEGLRHDCRTNQEEIFGPVVTIQPFKSDEEVLELANNTGYGLSATVWTNDLNRAHLLAERLHAGIVWINCWMVRDLRTPFGGMKNSGVGREGGLEALRFFTEPKNIFVNYRAPKTRDENL